MKLACVIVAAGRGIRMGGEIPKQYRMVNGQAVVSRAILAMLEEPRVEALLTVIRPQDGKHYHPAVANILDRRLLEPVFGGATRAQSVYKGLQALQKYRPKNVLIHDAARPFVPVSVTELVVDALENSAAVLPVLPITDTVWQRQAETLHSVDRNALFRAQTPQGFQFAQIFAAHSENKSNATDDISVARAADIAITLVEGSEENYKITTEDDLVRAERNFSVDVRIGTGFDVHAFKAGKKITLCGVDIAFPKSLDGHSDADVALHAITDAIFGALAQGDIGHWFPPSDQQWQGVASEIFLLKAIERAAAAGMRVSNLDCTIICELPKIAPYALAMRARIADICGIDSSRVSVKATTSEKLGFTGRGEGIAAMASATLVSR